MCRNAIENRICDQLKINFVPFQIQVQSKLKMEISCSQKVNRTETDRLKSKPVFNLNRFQVLAQDEAEILLKTLKTWVKLIMTNIKLIKIIIVQSYFQR